MISKNELEDMTQIRIFGSTYVYKGEGVKRFHNEEQGFCLDVLQCLNDECKLYKKCKNCGEYFCFSRKSKIYCDMCKEEIKKKNYIEWYGRMMKRNIIGEKKKPK